MISVSCSSLYVCILGPEYGTTEAAWQGLFAEADRVCVLHSGIRDQLANDVYAKVKQWQKETFTKQKLGGLKQHKEMDDGFTKVPSIF